MARRYRFTDTEPRYYPGLALNAEPGKTYDLAKAPDERFVTVKKRAAPKPRKPRAAASGSVTPEPAAVTPEPAETLES